MASTTHDDGFREIQLNGKQLVFLFMAVTVVSVVIFLCGVLVGRGVRAGSALAAAESTASGPALPAVEAPPPAATPGTSSVPGTRGETLTYADRLSGANLPREAMPTPPPPAPAQAPSVAAAAPAALAPPPPPGRAPEPGVLAPAPGEPPGAGLAIQVAALRERGEADLVANRLIAKGYRAYVVEPAAGTPPVYRVRVGKFTDKSEADGVAARLQKEEQFKPWIVR